MIPYEKLQNIIQQHPYPLVFATISGAHLYGFASPDSDFDLRGVHNLPLELLVGLEKSEETYELSSQDHGLDLDLVTHDAAKFFRLLLKKNGYVLEQLLSPLVVYSTPAFEELKSIVPAMITRHHANHYLGFAKNEWKLYQKETPRHVKPLLYVFRVLLTGIHLMRTGQVEAHLPTLNESHRLSYIPELIEQKVSDHEKAIMSNQDFEFYEKEYHRILLELQHAYDESLLPEHPEARDSLQALLLRLRLANSSKNS